MSVGLGSPSHGCQEGEGTGSRAVPPDAATVTVDAVLIGRNEGARLAAALAALEGQVRRVVYVDSGSTDGSVELARAARAEVVALDMGRPFTAARARNAGMAALDPAPEFVLFLDGDCALREGFVATALAAFAEHPRAVVVCGRRRERHPEASVWNRLADDEWNTPVGPARACGGDALMRYAAVKAAGGYRDDLIAGEEPELCLRLIRAGGEVWRVDAEMTWHDAGLLRFGQWWRRMVRTGHAFAEGASLHGGAPERHWLHETRRALAWGVALPVVAVVAGLVSPWGWLLLAAYPAQVLRLALRDGGGRLAWERAVHAVIGRFAEAQGALGFYLSRLRGRRVRLIEYR
ncbi:glycosyltransferase family 2 protein [Neotabrizicola shimadae]|uniref:Glycosyltransferase family 2 protein n=1 Tax=Neotabrizicola shimadae TaxID=2807096 RepID=A0A8G0ZUS6_9RHOB|nr:glycosyltransferase family 2 protein [Neotabrizicola shimadae]